MQVGRIKFIPSEEEIARIIEDAQKQSRAEGPAPSADQAWQRKAAREILKLFPLP